MWGSPAPTPTERWPSWTVIPWDSVYKETLDYQWDEVAVPVLEGDPAARGGDDVKVVIEMHPRNLVFNPATFKRLVDRTTPEGGTPRRRGDGPQPPVLAAHRPDHGVEDLGPLVLLRRGEGHPGHTETAVMNGVRRPVRVDPAEENPVGPGGHYTVTQAGPRSPGWSFVAVGRGHDVDFWTRFLTAITRWTPDMAMSAFSTRTLPSGQVED